MSSYRQLLPAPLRSILRKVRTIVSPPRQNAMQGFIGMTTIEERDYYASAMRKVAGLSGHVVDLGCWMGSTALSLAQGLDGKTGSKIYAFDLFRWDPWMDEHAAELWCDYKPGESFLPEARRRVSSSGGVIEPIAADLTTYEWKQGNIRLLLVDAMKSWELCAAISRNFFPSLIPGSLLIHQDYQCYNTVWIPLTQYRLRDCFRFAHGVRRGCTAAFETLRTPQLAELMAATHWDSVTNDEVAAAIDYSAALLGEHGKKAMAGCHVHHLAATGQFDAARALANRYESEGVERRGGFAEALARIPKV